MERAYSILNCKSMNDEQRVIEGWATTPAPDRVQDVIEPFGVKVADDIPLFMHHKAALVVGRAFFGKPTSKGIPFTAKIPKVTEAGPLRDRVDTAWLEVRYRLTTGVSVGFLPVRDKVERLKNGGMRFLESLVIELSLTPLPMNAEALITQFRSVGSEASRAALLNVIKSVDQATQQRAAGVRRPGVIYLRDPAHPVVYLDRP